MLKVIARIQTDFDEKFGVPRQGRLAPETFGRIVFEPEFRDVNSVCGMEGFSHLWVIWGFSENRHNRFSPTVRPPRLGGNKKMGVWATRSPYRPNPIGLTCVRIESVEITKDGPVINISGIDMVNNTPVYDIKPYIRHVDSIEDATSGFAGEYADYCLTVHIDDELLNLIPVQKRAALIKVLSLDPRPSYIQDEDREYGVNFAGFNIRFRVKDSELFVYDILNS